MHSYYPIFDACFYRFIKCIIFINVAELPVALQHLSYIYFTTLMGAALNRTYLPEVAERVILTLLSLGSHFEERKH